MDSRLNRLPIKAPKSAPVPPQIIPKATTTAPSLYCLTDEEFASFKMKYEDMAAIKTPPIKAPLATISVGSFG